MEFTSAQTSGLPIASGFFLIVWSRGLTEAALVGEAIGFVSSFFVPRSSKLAGVLPLAVLLAAAVLFWAFVVTLRLVTLPVAVLLY